jgi:hypothetical protein
MLVLIFTKCEKFVNPYHVSWGLTDPMILIACRTRVIRLTAMIFRPPENLHRWRTRTNFYDYSFSGSKVWHFASDFLGTVSDIGPNFLEKNDGSQQQYLKRLRNVWNVFSVSIVSGFEVCEKKICSIPQKNVPKFTAVQRFLVDSWVFKIHSLWTFGGTLRDLSHIYNADWLQPDAWVSQDCRRNLVVRTRVSNWTWPISLPVCVQVKTFHSKVYLSACHPTMVKERRFLTNDFSRSTWYDKG